MMAQTQSLSLPGRGPRMYFQPTYSSAGNGRPSSMGANWTHNFNSSVTVNKCGTVSVSGGDGGGVRFFPEAGGKLKAARGYHSEMVANSADNSFDFYTKNGSRHHYKWFNVNAQWVLDSITDTNGNRITIGYDELADEPRIVSAKTRDGREFRFAYEETPLAFAVSKAQRFMLKSVTGPDMAMRFKYDGLGNLTESDTNGRKEKFTYNTDGLLYTRHKMLTSADPLGRETTYVYNDAELGVGGYMMPHSYVTEIKTPTGPVKFDIDLPAMRKSSVTDQNGKATDYILNGYGNPLSVKDPVAETVMVWDESQVQMRSKKDGRGITTDYEYDTAGNQTRETTAGVSTERRYKIQTAAPFMKDRLEFAKDRNGNERTYGFDTNGNVTEEKLPEGVTIIHGYMGNGDRLSTRDGMNGQTTFTYDRFGNPETVKNPLGHTTETKRNARGQVTSLKDARGNITTFELDKHDQIKARTNAEGKKRTFEYDDNGNKLSETDENGNISTWAYGKHDLPETITRPGGSKTITYDGVGNKKTETDFRGNETTYEYDGANRLRTRTEPLDKVTRYVHDEVGNLKSETDANGGETKHVYNDLGYLIQTTDAEKGDWFMGRDDNGNKTSLTDPLSRKTTYTYDKLDRLKEQLAPLGARTTFTYDKNSNKLTEENPNRVTTRYEYDGANHLTKVTDGEDKQTTNSYDDNGNLKQVIDPNLNVTQFSYDKLNRKKDVKDGEGHVVEYEYDGVGNLTLERLPNDNRITHAYNRINLRTSSTDLVGSIGQWEYDADGNKTVEKDGLGRATTHTYNELSQLKSSAMPEGRTVTYTPDLLGNNTIIKDARNKESKHFYDKLNRLTQTIDAMGGQLDIVYDKVGNKKLVTDPLRGQTTTIYDELNRPTLVKDALGKQTRIDYDLVGNKIGERNKRGVESTFEYDKMNRLVSETKAGLLLVFNSYDGNGNVLSVTDANDNITSYVYDKRNLRKQEARLLGGITRFDLDSMGDVRTVTDPEGRISTNGYDMRRRLVSQKNGAGEETTFEYDLANNRTVTKRPLGARTTMVYDAANRVKSIEDPVGITKFGYDNNGNHTSVTDAEDNTTTFGFDDLNRRTSILYPGGASESFDYDANGNMKSHTDGKGIVITRTFDLLNREKVASYSTSDDGLKSVTRAYDENNNLTSVTQVGATTQTSTYTYDQFDREETSSDPFGATLKKTYDANGNKTSLITQDAKVTRYTYDTRNQLKTIASPSGSVTYSYDRSGLNTRVSYGNGVASTNSYDLAKRVKVVTHGKGTQDMSRTEYDYDKNGNRERETINRTAGAQVTTYEYDQADRLKKTVVTEAGKVETTVYGLDDVANRISETVTTVNTPGGTATVSKTYKYDGRNQLREIVDSVAGKTTLTYDDAGNLKRKELGGDLTEFRYNARDNLISVARNGTTLGTYGNDYRGLRNEKEAKDRLFPNGPRVRTRTLWDGQMAFQDTDTTGALLSRYESDGSNPVSMWNRQDGVQALHRDALGSVVATTDTTGQLKSETIYDAYGNVKETTGATANKFGYTGHEMDPETGLIYFKARYYDPAIGRFITQDPFEGSWDTPMSLHHYQYAYGNPTVFIDRDGHCAEPISATLCVAALAGIITWEGSVIHEELTQGSSFLDAASNPTHAIRGAMVGGVVLGVGVLAIEGAPIASAIWSDGFISGGLATLPQSTTLVTTILVPEAGGIYAGTRFARGALNAESAGSAFAAEARVAQAMASGGSGYSRVTTAAPKLGAAQPSVAIPKVTVEGGTKEVAASLPIVRRSVEAKPADATIAFQRVGDKSVRKTDYSTRVRKPTMDRLENGARGPDGTIRCQDSNCAVSGGRELKPGKGSPEHQPTLVESHNTKGFNMNQKQRNDLFNDTAKKLHCLPCQTRQGGATTEVYRRDVGPNYVPRQPKGKRNIDKEKP